MQHIYNLSSSLSLSIIISSSLRKIICRVSRISRNLRNCLETTRVDARWTKFKPTQDEAAETQRNKLSKEVRRNRDEKKAGKREIERQERRKRKGSRRCCETQEKKRSSAGAVWPAVHARSSFSLPLRPSPPPSYFLPSASSSSECQQSVDGFI